MTRKSAKWRAGTTSPPRCPRDRMWARIDAERADRRKVVTADFSPRRSPAFRILKLTAAVAAVLVLGILIGRMTQETGTPPIIDSAPVAVVKEPTPETGNLRRDVYAMAARDLFGRADFLLTDFKVRSCGKDDLSEVPDWAGGMLVQTRLLMDTPAADDLEMKNLLEELELVLAQIVGLSKDNCAVTWPGSDRASANEPPSTACGRFPRVPRYE